MALHSRLSWFYEWWSQLKPATKDTLSRFRCTRQFRLLLDVVQDHMCYEEFNWFSGSAWCSSPHDFYHISPKYLRRCNETNLAAIQLLPYFTDVNILSRQKKRTCLPPELYNSYRHSLWNLTTFQRPPFRDWPGVV